MKKLVTAFIGLFVWACAFVQYRTNVQQLILTSEDSLNSGTAKNKTVISGMARAVLFVGQQFN